MESIEPDAFDAVDADDAPRTRPRLYSIAPGEPFLPTLVAKLCDGSLIEGFRAGDDPAALADATIYVPTRRAARELRAAFVTSLGAGGTARAAILPRIRALGDADDDLGFFDEATPEALSELPMIGATERTVALAMLAHKWIKKLPEHLEGLHGGDRIEVPSSPADAVRMARDLERLMDEMERQGTPVSDLLTIEPGEHALWWQLTTEFLSIITHAWPDYLERIGRSNPAEHRNRAMRAEAARLRAGRERGPVIVATSPNLGPATVELVRAVAHLTRGAVVMPGLDRSLTDDEFRAVAMGAGGGEASPSHPQFGHCGLLSALGVSRDDVVPLGILDDPRAARRERAVAEALRPSDTTHRWIETAREIGADAFSEVELIEAPGPREEALAIAAALHRAIEEDGATAALVTPDRGLARRVAAELRRFGIEADDSAGVPLLRTPPGTLMRLAIAAAMDPTDPYALLGLLKHPLATLGLSRSAVRRATLLIELVVLRDGAPEPIDVLELERMLEVRLLALAAKEAEGKRTPHWWSRFTDEDGYEALEVVARTVDALRPLAEARLHGLSVPPSVWSGFLAHTLDTIGKAEDGTHDAIYADAAGTALSRALSELMGEEDEHLLVSGSELWGTMEAFLDAVPVRPPVRGHPRVAILGLIESRLLHHDCVVLGGLNEGAWPRQSTNDAFLSRPMRQTLSLEPPERRIGLEAHDFTMMMGAPRVVLSRAIRADGSPTTPSRWLQRLEAVLSGEAMAGMRARGDVLLRCAAELDAPTEGERVAIHAPRPAPPLEARPRALSVTEIETLRRDPYALYAKRVLGLVPLDAPRAVPDQRDRGTLFHLIAERMVLEKVDASAPDARSRLDRIADRLFAEAGLPDDIAVLWWARYETMAPHLLAWEAERRGTIDASHVEAKGRIEVGGILLTGKADRIDVMGDGTIEIIDYKTGTDPSAVQAKTLLSPQLPIEAAMARRGAFPDLGVKHAGSLAYVRLRPGETAKGKPNFAVHRVETAKPSGVSEVRAKELENESADELGERAWQRLQELLARFAKPDTAYESRLIPMRGGAMDGDYDHLARVREWGTAVSGEDGDGGEE